MISREDLKSSLPKLTGEVRLKGLAAPVDVYRDRFGIPHVKAQNEKEAFFAQGFVTAQDRLWQMEYDRRRGSGRWAEVVGDSAVDQDKLMRRFGLASSAKADYEAADEPAQRMFDAYASGVNAFIDTTKALPIEYSIANLDPEPWLPWDGLIVYKVRHILMGVFESKLWRARMVKELGPERAGTLFPGYEPGQLLILPPGERYLGELDTGLDELTAGLKALKHMTETDGGSNSWALSGSRTGSGKPLLAGDSHRALDTPNVYYQNHLACPEFDVVGLSFPGVPGFPHFGHNPWVAWCVTHTAADYQDLYIERFKEGDANYYLDQEQWREAEVRDEKIRVRGGQEVDCKVWVTQHGPIIAGDPERGNGLAFKYSATQAPSAWAGSLQTMLVAQNSGQLMESMRDWVDPCNNFLVSDVHGSIGYLCRGQIPIRSMANAWLPVPGWTGEHEWEGFIPFDEMPRSVDPVQGYIATANNKPVGDDYPYYIAIDYTPEFRVKRVTQGLNSLLKPAAADMAKVHAERTSIPALAYIDLLRQVEPLDELSGLAKQKLLAWSGTMDAHRVEPTIYSACRDALLRELLEHNLGADLAEAAWNPADRGLGSFINRFKARLVSLIPQGDVSLLPDGEDWSTVMARALNKGVETLRERLGGDLEEWRWERVHQARPQHTLSAAFPELADLLDPPAIPANGDGDTPLAGGYSAAAPATITSLSVARYAYDLNDWDNSLWVVPLGSSGHPGSRHYHDQSDHWRKVEMVPMLYSWEKVEADCEEHQRLEGGD
jgi:penicillin amidase